MSEPSSPKIELDLERAAPPLAPVVPPPVELPPARAYTPAPTPVAYAVEPSYRSSALRVAGLILLFNFGLSIWLLGQGEKGGLMVGSLVIDAIIAPMLLLGKESIRRWALVRAILGLLVGSLLAYTAASSSPYAWVGVALNALYCGGLILLLTGEEVGLGRLVTGGALSGASLCLIIVAVAFAHAAMTREPSPQTAFNGRVSILGFASFQAVPNALPQDVQARFDEADIQNAISPAGAETVWVYRPKAGVTLDPDKAIRATFQGFQASADEAGQEAPARAESHGDLDGEGISNTLTMKGQPLHARIFIAQRGDAYWMFLIVVPARRGTALSDRILDSIQINS